jgi:two-component system, cell cycle sensor histidine kinase and response regulator CckA
VGLSIRWKLFLFIGGLVTVVALAFGGAAYRAVRQSALAAASVHLTGIASQWARLFEGGVARQIAASRATARSAEVRNALASRDPAALAAAGPALRALLPPGQISRLQLLDRERRLLVALGDSAAGVSSPVDPALLDSAAARDSLLAGPLRAVGQAIAASYAMPVTVDGAVAGYLTQTTLLKVTPSPAELNKLFGGTATSVRVANRDGSVWTDLAQPIPGPSSPMAPSADLQSYDSPVSGLVFASTRPIAGTPWMVVLESADAEVLGPSRRLLIRLMIGGAIAIALGMMVAVAMSGSLTRPLERLTDSAEAVAAGDYSRLTGVRSRRDELGRLTRAFDTMVARVHEAFAARRDAESYYRGLFESVPLPTWLYDRDTFAILAVNDAAIRHYGYQREEFLAMTVADLRPPEDLHLLQAAIREAGDGPHHRGEWRHRKKDGTLIDVEVHATSMLFQGRHARLVVVHDLTEAKQGLEQIRRADERYRRLVEESSDGITLARVQGGFISVNPAFVHMLGYESEAELSAVNPADLFDDPAERETIRAKLMAAGHLRRQEIHLRRKDGHIITAQLTARLVNEPGGSDRYVESVLADVTELRRAERQLQQAQKMDAVGQLAGGIAHDFNNLLTVILSYGDLLRSAPGLAVDDREAVEAIHEAATSAAALTRQLLTFSRQEIVQPRVMRLNDLITGTGKMLQRLIGEHVELATILAPDAGAVKVDPGQLEQVIVNLAVNARDAMPGGGRLLIESRNLEIQGAESETGALIPPGDYVLLVVSDNGAGMDAATQARIFEPFFSTKARGKGTGLGLATVYGIVKQSGGHIAVYSEPGRGTNFKIYLPRVGEPSAAPQRPADSPEPLHGTETILLVEDEANLRSLVCRLLEPRGYTVLSASGGAAALEVAANHAGPIHMLLTDVVMPGMSGPALAERITGLRADIRVLFMSGYTDDAILHHGVLQSGMQFIEKPFNLAALARKVRQVLDER